MDDNKIRRINIMGGPCSGKSLLAANIRARLGLEGYNIELVEEVIKDWTYIPRPPKLTDSFYLQACQMQKEEIRLRAGVDLIVSDSPILLQFFYARYHKAPLQTTMLLASQCFDKMYPPLYVFLQREDDFYGELGRYEKLDEAREIDEKLKAVMTSMDIEFKEFSCLNQDDIINYVISRVELPDVENKDTKE